MSSFEGHNANFFGLSKLPIGLSDMHAISQQILLIQITFKLNSALLMFRRTDLVWQRLGLNVMDSSPLLKYRLCA